jgi:hypothetical protein
LVGPLWSPVILGAGHARPAGPVRATETVPAEDQVDLLGATELSRGRVLARLLAPPFAFDHAKYQAGARSGLREVLDWLQSLPVMHAGGQRPQPRR